MEMASLQRYTGSGAIVAFVATSMGQLYEPVGTGNDAVSITLKVGAGIRLFRES